MSMDDLAEFETGSKAKKGPRSHRYAPLILGIYWGAIGFLLWFGVPKVEAIFQDFGVDLPSLTKTFIRASHFAWSYPAVLALLLVVLIIVDLLVLKTLARKGNGIAYPIWRVFTWVVPSVVLVLMVVGVFLPLISISLKLNP
jgi:type II secretory pathway component PulF